MNLSSITEALGSYRSRYGELESTLARIGEMIARAEAEVAELTGGRRGSEAGGGGGRGRGGRRGRRAAAESNGAASSASARNGRRGRKASSGMGRRAAGEDLTSYLVKALTGSSKPMGIADVAEAVKKAGYSSSSPSFAKIVGMRLGSDKRFKRAGRGLYELKK